VVGALALAGALGVMLGVAGGRAAAGWPLPRAGLLAGAAAGALVLAGDFLGRVLARRSLEVALRLLTGAYRAILLPSLPLVAALGWLFPLRDRRGEADEDEASEEEIEAFLDVGAQEGILEPGEGRLIQRLIDFGDARVKSVMTPRIDIVAAPAASDVEALAEVFLTSNHSRLPVFDESIDEIVGIVHIRSLLTALRSESGGTTARSLAAPPYFVPESKLLTRLLRELQANRQQIAIVVDEYGGTAGLVTIEDLLEEIVGEIEDEHDEDRRPIRLLPDGSWRVDGRVDLATVAELFDSAFEAEPYETLGGLVFGAVGAVPEVGSRVSMHGLQITVEDVVERRVRSLRVRRLTHAGGGNGA